MKRFGLWLLFVLTLGGCGNAAPTIEEARLSTQRLSRGRELFVTLVGVEDPDGDVYSGKVKVKMKGDNGNVDLEEELFLNEPFQAQKGDVIFGLQPFGAFEFGTYTLEVVFEDEGGADSDPVMLMVELTT